MRKGASLETQLEEIAQIAGGDIDGLYLLILNQCLLGQDREVFTLELLKVLRCLTVLQRPQPLSVIDALVESHNDFDVSKCLHALSSLYASGMDMITDDTVVRPHKSFFDFVTIRAPPDFRVDTVMGHHELALACFRIMREELHFNMGDFNSPRLDTDAAPSKVDEHVIYACAAIPFHAQASSEVLITEIHFWAENLFFFWLEAINLPTNGADNYWGDTRDLVEKTLRTFRQKIKVIHVVPLSLIRVLIFERLRTMTVRNCLSLHLFRAWHFSLRWLLKSTR
jgi:hypothetical protein